MTALTRAAGRGAPWGHAAAGLARYTSYLVSLSSVGALFFALASPAVAEEQGITPPEVLTRTEARLPPTGEPPLRDELVLELTIDVDGHARDVQVIQSAGPAYDAAAVDAVKQWTFRPALQAGVPVAARTRLPFRLPAPVPPPGTAAPPDSARAPPAPDPSTAATPAVPAPGSESNAPAPDVVRSTVVVGRSTPRVRGASDFQLQVGELSAVPRKSATELLKLAPGILLTNEGGEGHPEQIFLRGFDAREGQDLELTAGGVPVNQSGNLHGNGYADLHFVIPELVEGLRILEGPFDPRQGNYAVAGSADYELGLAQRGVTVKASAGSFDTQRVVLLFGPPGESNATYGGVELYQTAGFGQNRDAQRGAAMAGYEGRLGDLATFRLGATAYAARYHSAGVLRDDDVRAGRIGFYDTYDPRQGGDSSRFSLNADLEGRAGSFTHHHEAFFVLAGTRLRENFTGYLLDSQEAIQQPHAQRGDLLDLDVTAATWGLRGWGRTRGEWGGLPQDLEVGYFARLDQVDSSQYRIETGTNAPYKLDTDLSSKLGDLGLYADANLRPLPWLTLRGGARAELFTYDVLDRCAVQSVDRPSPANPPGDKSCLDQQNLGRYREPAQRASTAASVLMPRAAVLVGPFQGVTFTASYGQGARSIDPQYITQDVRTPFAGISATELGATYGHSFSGAELSARAVGFSTHVDRDLIFSETLGRNTLATGTTRLGAIGAGRLTGSFFDIAANLTLVHSTFDDTGLLVPYVPDVVFRSDAAVFHALPLTFGGDAVRGSAALGLTYVGRRPLPYGCC